MNIIYEYSQNLDRDSAKELRRKLKAVQEAKVTTEKEMQSKRVALAIIELTLNNRVRYEGYKNQMEIK